MPKPTSCIDCSAPLKQKSGPGRGLLRCDRCRDLEAERAARQRNATMLPFRVYCCECGKPLRGGGKRLPQGEGRCRECHGKGREPAEHLIQCATCTRMFTAIRKNAKYCSPDCSPWTKRRTQLNPRDLDARHRQIRRAFAVLIATGTERCCLCSEVIASDAPWDLDHTADREGYRGASHAACNRREGALRRNGVSVFADPIAS